jgi:phospholipid transport system transporter-binding protein
MAVEARFVNDTLVLGGELDRAAASQLWPQLAAHAGSVARIDLQATTRLDSAGLALLSHLAGPGLELLGHPAGLDELIAAYRLSPQLGFSPPHSPVV